MKHHITATLVDPLVRKRSSAGTELGLLSARQRRLLRRHSAKLPRHLATAFDVRSIGDPSLGIGAASLLVAMHPDQATVHVVDAALQHGLPFAVVPCCTCSHLFPRRQLRCGTPVREYEQLLQFIQEKDDTIQRARLNFEGKNVVLYKLG